MPDFADFFMIITEQLLFSHFIAKLLVSVGEECVQLGLRKPLINFIADSL